MQMQTNLVMLCPYALWQSALPAQVFSNKDPLMQIGQGGRKDRAEKAGIEWLQQQEQQGEL
jgi:hypothetical protein